MTDEFARNLSYLCGYYPSIAEVCRRLHVNRQQFNKYLSGQVRPSRHNMRRICDFFGVTESEVMLEHPRFVEIISLRRRPVSTAALAGPLEHIEALYAQSGDLERYVGYYYRYFYAFSYPGYIIKSLARIFEKDGRYYWRNIERLQERGAEGTTTGKYAGAVFFLAERIFIVEYDQLLRNGITQVALYPSYHTKIDYLRGIQTGEPAKRGRKPAASLVLMEYLGTGIDIRKALLASGLFPGDSDAISPKIRGLITNRIPEGSYVLEAEET